MRYNKLFLLVRRLMTENEAYRNSDKRLMWRVWQEEGMIIDKLSLGNFLSSQTTTPESVTRARRKIQELHPELRATDRVYRARHKKQMEKGTHIFRENVRLVDPLGIIKEAV